jgi:hypothetical protein
MAVYLTENAGLFYSHAKERRKIQMTVPSIALLFLAIAPMVR